MLQEQQINVSCALQPSQDGFNRKLAQMRQIQPSYSDIYGLSDLATIDSIDDHAPKPVSVCHLVIPFCPIISLIPSPRSQISNRSRRVTQNEIQPSGADPIYR